MFKYLSIYKKIYYDLYTFYYYFTKIYKDSIAAFPVLFVTGFADVPNIDGIL